MKTIVIVVAVFAIAGSLDAAVLSQYNFTGSVRTSSDSDLNSTATDFTDGPGITGTIDAGRGNPLPSISPDLGTTANTQALALSGNDYFTFTITPAGGFQLNLTSITFDSAVFGNITATFFVRSSVDNFTTDLGTVTTSSTTFTNTNISLTGAPFQNVTTSLSFRLYVFDNQDNGNRGGLLDNIVLNGVTILIPEPASWATFMVGAGVLVASQRFRRKKTLLSS